MDRYAADRTVKRLARHAGITKHISPHSLRHSFITAALDAGVPLRDVQEAASHADPAPPRVRRAGRRSGGVLDVGAIGEVGVWSVDEHLIVTIGPSR